MLEGTFVSHERAGALLLGARPLARGPPQLPLRTDRTRVPERPCLRSFMLRQMERRAAPGVISPPGVELNSRELSRAVAGSRNIFCCAATTRRFST